MKHEWIPWLIVTAVGAACSVGEGGKPAPIPDEAAGQLAGEIQPMEVRSVRVRASRARRRPATVLSNTMLEPSRRVTIRSQLNAIVENLLVEEGSRVGKGERLARLQDREVRNHYIQAQLAVQQVELAVQQAELKSELSVVHYERALALFQEKLVGRQVLDLAVLSSKTDELAYEAAKGEHEAAKAHLEAARIEMDYAEIRSSIEGVVTKRLVEVGDRVNVLQAAFTVEDFTPILAPIFVTEKELTRLRVGQKAQVQVEIFPEQEFEGVIKIIGPVVDAASRTVKVIVQIRGTYHQLRPGLFGTVSIPIQTRHAAVLLPRKAVIREGKQSSVFIIQPDDTVEKREVFVGEGQDECIEILQGVEEGETVVSYSEEALSDGDSVTILAWEDLKEPAS